MPAVSCIQYYGSFCSCTLNKDKNISNWHFAVVCQFSVFRGRCLPTTFAAWHLGLSPWHPCNNLFIKGLHLEIRGLRAVSAVFKVIRLRFKKVTRYSAYFFGVGTTFESRTQPGTVMLRGPVSWQKCTMTELIISRGDTFPRALLDTYRASKNIDFYSDLSSSKSDELVLQNPVDIPVTEEIHHGHSENLLDTGCGSPTKEDFLDKPDLLIPKYRNKRASVYDRVDPEDSIRDIVSENDFYR